MKLVETTDQEAFLSQKPIAESSEFAIYAVGNDTYTLVHRHKAVAWQAITLSGDGLFRVSELLVGATRALYRDVALDLSNSKTR